MSFFPHFQAGWKSYVSHLLSLFFSIPHTKTSKHTQRQNLPKVKQCRCSVVHGLQRSYEKSVGFQKDRKHTKKALWVVSDPFLALTWLCDAFPRTWSAGDRVCQGSDGEIRLQERIIKSKQNMECPENRKQCRETRKMKDGTMLSDLYVISSETLPYKKNMTICSQVSIRMIFHTTREFVFGWFHFFFFYQFVFPFTHT